MGGRKASVGRKGLWRPLWLHWDGGLDLWPCSWVCGCGFPCIGQSERYQGIPHTIWRKSVGVGFRRPVIVLIVWVSWGWRLVHRSSIIGDTFRMVLRDRVYIHVSYQYQLSTRTFIHTWRIGRVEGGSVFFLKPWWITERERWYD